MEEVGNEIKETKTKLAIAEMKGDLSSRDFLRTYLIQIQQKENLLLQQQIQQASAAPGNISIPCIPLSYIAYFPYLYFILRLINFIC